MFCRQILVKSIFIRLMLSIMFSLACTAQASEKGLFWQLESPAGTVSYLFGTIHTDDKRVTDFSPIVIAALNRVDTFIMETKPTQQSADLHAMQDTNLRDMLTAQELEQVRQLADFHAMHLDTALRSKPWLLAMMLDLPKPKTPFSQDNLLMEKSEAFGKNIEGLASSEAHASVLDDLSREEQLAMLRAVLKRTQAQKEADFERLIAAYLKGDADKIRALDEQITRNRLPAKSWAKIRVKLLDERNAAMAERSIQAANKQSAFIAVGASHLAGKTGMIHAFRQAGFKCTKMPQ